MVLGVAFVAGSFIFTDAMGDAFDGIIEGSTADVEIAYQGANDFDSQQDARTIPASVVDRLDQLPEVGVRAPERPAAVGLRDRPQRARSSAATARPAWRSTTPAPRSVSRQADHHAEPRRVPDAAPAEVALDVDTARKAGYGVGDTVTLVTPGDPPTLKAKVVGLVEFGSGGLNGATLTLFDVRVHAGAVLRRQGRLLGDLARRRARGDARRGCATPPRRCCRADVVARTGDALVKKNKAQLDEILGFLNTFLLVFAGGLAGGRHLPDHQHLLDPGRAAQPRARAAAGARRLAPPGERLGAGRGGRRRPVRLDARARRRLPARPRAAAAVRRGRLRPEPGGVPGQPAHGRRVVRRRACWSRSSRRTSRPGAPPRSRRSRRCATTWRCRRRRCAAGCSSASG